jgi:hypothetical protein
MIANVASVQVIMRSKRPEAFGSFCSALASFNAVKMGTTEGGGRYFCCFFGTVLRVSEFFWKKVNTKRRKQETKE